MKSHFLFRMACLVVIGLPAFSASLSAAAADLAYKFQAGSNYVYAVRIVATEPKYIVTSSGNLTYHVKAATQDGITLTSRGSLNTQRKAREGTGMRPPFFGDGALRIGGFRFWDLGPMGDAFPKANEVQIDAKGRVLRETGNAQLPQAFGALSRIAIEQLAPDGKAEFEVATDCVLLTEEKQFVTPMTYRLKEVRLPAKEKTTYTIGSATGGIVAVKKVSELKTLATHGGQPAFEIKGEGTNTFDVKLGVFREFSFSGTIVENGENVTVRVPVTLSVKLLEGAELAEALKPPPPLPKIETKPITADERASLLADLKSENSSRRAVALSRFGTVAPSEPKEEVESVLLEFLKSSDGFAKQNAAKALSIWGGKACIEPLIKQLDDSAFNARWAAIEALGRLKDPRAVAPLAKLIVENKDTFHASNSLKSIGAAAEDVVLKLLDEKSAGARREACQILKVIGTAKSVPALEKAARDSDGLVSMFAKEALKKAKETKRGEEI